MMFFSSRGRIEEENFKECVHFKTTDLVLTCLGFFSLLIVLWSIKEVFHRVHTSIIFQYIVNNYVYIGRLEVYLDIFQLKICYLLCR